MSSIARYADVAVFSIPAAIPAALAACTNYLEHLSLESKKEEEDDYSAPGQSSAPTESKDEKNVKVAAPGCFERFKEVARKVWNGIQWAGVRTLNGIGWVTTRLFTVIAVAAGLVAVVYAVVKTIFAFLLNAITLRKVECLRNFEALSKAQVNISFLALGILGTLLVTVDLEYVYKNSTEDLRANDNPKELMVYFAGKSAASSLHQIIKDLNIPAIQKLIDRYFPKEDEDEGDVEIG
jgi:hypothetical protein